MAEKIELSTEDKIALAKELYSRGSRNYLVKDYSESADDLSKASELYAEVYGNYADELGMTYMLYAKALIALAQQGENKLLTLPDEEEDDDEEGEEEENEKNQQATEASVEDDKCPELVEVKQPTVHNKENGDNDLTSATDPAEAEPDKQSQNDNTKKKPTSDDNNKPSSSCSMAATASTTNMGKSTKQTELNGDDGEVNNDEDDADDSPTENLQIAWEALEMAVQIFKRQGEPALANLADAYFELAEISLENSNFETAISDFKKSLDIRMKLPTNDLRIIAEIHYKIGLNYLMLGLYEQSVVSLKEANYALDCEIESQKEKDPQTEEIDRIITEIEELKQEIANKVQEIEETKEQSMEEVKKELSKLIGTTPQTERGSVGLTVTTHEGQSSSINNDASKSKPNDISNLIKRKKPESANTSMEIESSAKRPAL